MNYAEEIALQADLAELRRMEEIYHSLLSTMMEVIEIQTNALAEIEANPLGEVKVTAHNAMRASEPHVEKLETTMLTEMSGLSQDDTTELKQ